MEKHAGGQTATEVPTPRRQGAAYLQTEEPRDVGSLYSLRVYCMLASSPPNQTLLIILLCSFEPTTAAQRCPLWSSLELRHERDVWKRERCRCVDWEGLIQRSRSPSGGAHTTAASFPWLQSPVTKVRLLQLLSLFSSPRQPRRS